MNDRERLFEAILAEPDDDLPRLVFADWLEEHGETDRAEFIRVQCARARLPYDDDRVSELQAREYRLLAAHHAEWTDGHSHGLFERGFVESTGWWDLPKVLESGAGAFARNPTRDLAIGFRDHGWGEPLALLPCLSRIETLRFTRSEYTRIADALAVLASPRLTRLQTLDASGCRGFTGDFDGDDGLFDLLGVPGRARRNRSEDGLLPSLRRLRKLSLRNMGLTDRGLRALLASPLAATLTHLDISANYEITSDGIRALISSALWPRLEELAIGRVSRPHVALVERLVDALPQSRIRKLHFDRLLGKRPARGVAGILAAARSWGKLEALWSYDNPFGTNAEVEAFGRCPHLPQLRRLDLWDAGLNDAVLEILARSPGIASLHTLWIDHNHDATDRGLQALAASPYFRPVDFACCMTLFKDAGIGAFAESASASRLRAWVVPENFGNAAFSRLAQSTQLARLNTFLSAGGAGPWEDLPMDEGLVAVAQSSRLPNLAVISEQLHCHSAARRAFRDCERLVCHPGGNFSQYNLFDWRPNRFFSWTNCP